MKIQARHKLIPAIAMLLVSVILVSSASYAWFTMSRTVTATGMTLTAVAPNNLLISNAQNGDFAESTVVTAPTNLGKLMPSSSADGLKFFATDNTKTAYAGAPDFNTTFTDVSTKAVEGGASLENAKDGYYYDFHLYLKTTGGQDVTVNLLDSNTSDATETFIKSVGDAAKIIPSVRMAVLNISAAETSDNLDGTRSKLATGSIYSFDGNYNYFANLKDPATAGGVDATIKGPIAEAGKADAAAAAIPTDKIGQGVALADTDKIATTDDMFVVKADEAITHIVVRIWVEGQDADCINANADLNQFTIGVAFKDKTYGA